MKKTKISFSGTGFRLILSLVIFTLVFSFITGCYTDKKSSPATADMVVIFNSDVPIAKASSILFEKEYIFHEGIDNRNRKKYSTKTGPEYTVKVPKEKIEFFNSEMKNNPQIYDIYKAE